MRQLVLCAVMVFGFFGVQSIIQAAPEATAPAKAVEVGNKVCPVSGEKIGDMGSAGKFEYKGKIYNLCCPMCEEDFKKDPEKYSKIADDEVAASAGK